MISCASSRSPCKCKASDKINKIISDVTSGLSNVQQPT